MYFVTMSLYQVHFLVHHYISSWFGIDRTARVLRDFFVSFLETAIPFYSVHDASRVPFDSPILSLYFWIRIWLSQRRIGTEEIVSGNIKHRTYQIPIAAVIPSTRLPPTHHASNAIHHITSRPTPHKLTPLPLPRNLLTPPIALPHRHSFSNANINAPISHI